MPGTARATARANIAFAKYWGKANVPLNLPAVPSLSVTLDPLLTRTQVTFGGASEDVIVLNGVPADPTAARRAVELLDRIRALAGIRERARVESRNEFPTASGLASSASGFAALAGAAAAAAGLALSDAALSALARRSSASAARSVFGGYVELPAGQDADDSLAAQALAPASHWDLRVLVAVVTEGKKPVGSTDAMGHTAKTSPYYSAWLEAAPRLYVVIREAVLRRDLPALGAALEQSAMAMHACALAASPPLSYWQAGSVGALETVRRLRAEGVQVFATMDAGPHVKAVCHADDAARVEQALAKTPGVLRTLTARPGPGLEIERG